MQQVWFLAWASAAILHGHNIFVTHAMNYPDGVNLFSNTSMLLLGVLAAPLTWLVGPVASFGALLRLGFVASALSAASATRRLGKSWSSSWLVGLLFGFGSYRTSVGMTHVFAAVDVTTPWLLFTLIRLSQSRWTLRRSGVMLGLLIGLGGLISLERSVIYVVVVAACGLVALIRGRSRATLQSLGETGGWLTVVAVSILALPTYFYLWGPQALHKNPHSSDFFASFTTTWRDVLQPGPSHLWSPVGHQGLDVAAISGVWSNPSYLGIPLIVAAGIGAYRRRHEPLTRAAVGLSTLLVMISMGRNLPMLGNVSLLNTPSWVLGHVPLVGSITPDRYMNTGTLVISFLAVGAFDGARRWRQHLVRSGLAALVALALVVSILPAASYPVVATGECTWLSSPEAHSVITQNAVVVAYPYPMGVFNQGMLDQAQSGIYYRLVGGYAIVPNAHSVLSGVAPLRPYQVFDTLTRAYLGPLSGPSSTYPFKLGEIPPYGAATAGVFRKFVRMHHVNFVVYQNVGAYPELARLYLGRAFGAGRVFDHGQVVVWKVSK